LNYLFIEDTGKVYPLAEMKVGLVAASPALIVDLRRVTDELLLNTSPFVLSLLGSVMALDLRISGSSAGRRLEPERVVQGNRAALLREVQDVRQVASIASSRLSVAWLRVRAGRTSDLCARWSEVGLVTLPGDPFFWDDPSHGESFIRVALARDPVFFARGAALLRKLLQGSLA
jgi:hypothetical protein